MCPGFIVPCRIKSREWISRVGNFEKIVLKIRQKLFVSDIERLHNSIKIELTFEIFWNMIVFTSGLHFNDIHCLLKDYREPTTTPMLVKDAAVNVDDMLKMLMTKHHKLFSIITSPTCRYQQQRYSQNVLIVQSLSFCQLDVPHFGGKHRPNL